MKRLFAYCVFCVGVGAAVACARAGAPFLLSAVDALTVSGGCAFAVNFLLRFFVSEYGDGVAYSLRFRLGAAVSSSAPSEYYKFKEWRKEKRGQTETDGAWLGGVLFLLGALFFPFFY